MDIMLRPMELALNVMLTVQNVSAILHVLLVLMDGLSLNLSMRDFVWLVRLHVLLVQECQHHALHVFQDSSRKDGNAKT